MRMKKLLEKLQKNKRLPSNSIYVQLASAFILLIAGTIVSCILFNTAFLGKYYLMDKKESLKRVYLRLEEAIQQDEFMDNDFDVELEQLSGKYNMDILVLDADSNLIKLSRGNADKLKNHLWDYIFNDAVEADKEMPEISKPRVLISTQNYQIRLMMDPHSNMEFIEMWGFLENGNMFVLRSAMDSIKDSAKISNMFFINIGLYALIIVSLMVFAVSKKITNPILELTRISERMTNLDFNEKYRSKSKNEIDTLGENFNKLSDTLEKTISELRTANNELRRDVETKDKIEKIRQEFVSNVSHELKTPIALIQGYAEGLKEGMGDDPETRDYYVDVIRDEAVRMNEMVKKLLTLDEMEMGGTNVTIVRFNLSLMVKNILKNLEIIFKQQGIDVVNQMDEEVYVWADEIKTEEAIRNYLSNATNYCEEKKGLKQVVITTVKNDSKLKISVFNTGNNIPEEALPNLWDKFYKVDKARSREYGGSGVGLSIVKAAMESMGAGYGVANTQNGVEFWLELNIV